jgi:hypothetical protein
LHAAASIVLKVSGRIWQDDTRVWTMCARLSLAAYGIGSIVLRQGVIVEAVKPCECVYVPHSIYVGWGVYQQDLDLLFKASQVPRAGRQGVEGVVRYACMHAPLC